MAGTGISINIKVEWPDGEIAKELSTAMQEYGAAVQFALDSVAADTKEALREHIFSDVYAQWSTPPQDYVRRYYAGGLLDPAAMQTIDLTAQTRGTLLRGLMTIVYAPDGNHQFENPASGDDLIGRIESGKGYEWRRHPGPRPFWEKFVNEIIDGNRMGKTFDAAMYSALGSEYAGESVVEKEADDGQYSG